MREKKRFKYIKIFWYLNQNLLKRRDTKYQLNYNLERQELRI